MSTLKEDLVLISDLPDTAFAEIVNIVNADSNKQIEWSVYLGRLSADEVKDASQALFRFINTLGEAFSNARKFDKELTELDSAITKMANNDDRALAGWSRVKNNLNKLTPFFVNRKEDSIKSRFSIVTEASITVDARPVFSLDKKKVEKVIYPIILKLETSDDRSFICEFYEDQLELLEDEIKMAKEKRDSLVKMLNK